MGDIPFRGPATTWLVTLLTEGFADADLEFGVGDGIAPDEFGWPSGQPGAGLFRPYLVVKTLQANSQRNPQPLATSQADAWLFPYQLTGWGEVREQADDVCDQANAILAQVDPKAYRGDGALTPGFNLQQLVVAPLGTTDRDDKVSPQMWSRTDICTLWLARANPTRRG